MAEFVFDQPAPDDHLGYRPHAKLLAEKLVSILTSSELDVSDGGFVVGIQGSWGTGKSTFIQYVSDELQRLAADRVVVVNFDPWWISDHGDITLNFFRTLIAALPKNYLRHVPWFRPPRRRADASAGPLCDHAGILVG